MKVFKFNNWQIIKFIESWPFNWIYIQLDVPHPAPLTRPLLVIRNYFFVNIFNMSISKEISLFYILIVLI